MTDRNRIEIPHIHTCHGNSPSLASQPPTILPEGILPPSIPASEYLLMPQLTVSVEQYHKHDWDKYQETKQNNSNVYIVMHT